MTELSKAQNSPKLVESPKLNKKRKKEMPELKRLNVPTEYNSNENLQAIPSPIKTLQDVRYIFIDHKSMVTSLCLINYENKTYLLFS